MFAPTILARSLSREAITDRYGNRWQYHSRSDRHSKIACWGIVIDLLITCGPLARHVREGRIGFGINHEIRDFRNDRKKNLDLVLCTPASVQDGKHSIGLSDLVAHYEIELTQEERVLAGKLPEIKRTAVGTVVLALEAKACMTAHQRALPRLYDELK